MRSTTDAFARHVAPVIEGADGSIAARVAALDWAGIAQALNERGSATTGPVLTPAECRAIAAL